MEGDGARDAAADKTLPKVSWGVGGEGWPRGGREGAGAGKGGDRELGKWGGGKGGGADGCFSYDVC